MDLFKSRLSYDETDKDFILLKIKDNGKGISKEKQKNLFKRFYEGDYSILLAQELDFR